MRLVTLILLVSLAGCYGGSSPQFAKAANACIGSGHGTAVGYTVEYTILLMPGGGLRDDKLVSYRLTTVQCADGARVTP